MKPFILKYLEISKTKIFLNKNHCQKDSDVKRIDPNDPIKPILVHNDTYKDHESMSNCAFGVPSALRRNSNDIQNISSFSCNIFGGLLKHWIVDIGFFVKLESHIHGHEFAFPVPPNEWTFFFNTEFHHLIDQLLCLSIGNTFSIKEEYYSHMYVAELGPFARTCNPSKWEADF